MLDITIEASLFIPGTLLHGYYFYYTVNRSYLWLQTLYTSLTEATAYTYLNVLSKSPEHLFGHVDGPAEVALARRVDDLLARVVPVEVHHGLLQPQ